MVECSLDVVSECLEVVVGDEGVVVSVGVGVSEVDESDVLDVEVDVVVMGDGVPNTSVNKPPASVLAAAAVNSSV